MEPMSIDGKGRKRLDANRYATKKTLAQGMLDIALLTANASQLKYVLQVGEEKHPFFYLLLVLIISSIVLQASVGVLFLIIGGLNINKEPNQKRANILNDVIVVLIFLITLDNVVISGFGIRHTDMNVNPERL
ncbi:ninjurin-2-like isoform X5 [Tigriopus californicus]|uniref:ninjurin-2-like isoform X5 n=1 Tax=Tigriopus californicus TaxID=6832 RepID=UPI0027DA39A9|nr:ninjurin-2-like isoform X5 [Tigriopus californicus]